MFRRASKLSQSDYNKKISEGLDRAHGSAQVESKQLADLQLVIFSDMHRGARDGADDFERCEPAYSAALGWYLEREFELCLLGDVEELWENDIDEVLPKYQAVMDLEAAFMRGPGLRRFYGNHDLDWRDEAHVRTYLEPSFPGIQVKEALRLRVLDGQNPLGEIFLVHGHQGTDLSDRGSWLSRLALRRVWRKVQASQGFLSTTPAESHELRHKHDQAMFRWAREHAIGSPPDQRSMVIAGHTHHPVLPDNPPPRPSTADAARLIAELKRARSAGAGEEAIAPLRAELERIRALGRRVPYDATPIEPPCYFNTGCCCFPDRDVTCLEISAGEIRLIRWLDDDGAARPQLLAPGLGLRAIFERLSAA